MFWLIVECSVRANRLVNWFPNYGSCSCVGNVRSVCQNACIAHIFKSSCNKSHPKLLISSYKHSKPYYHASLRKQEVFLKYLKTFILFKENNITNSSWHSKTLWEVWKSKDQYENQLSTKGFTLEMATYSLKSLSHYRIKVFGGNDEV
jgi:quinol monooxygenase YgiN